MLTMLLIPMVSCIVISNKMALNCGDFLGICTGCSNMGPLLIIILGSASMKSWRRGEFSSSRSTQDVTCFRRRLFWVAIIWCHLCDWSLSFFVQLDAGVKMVSFIQLTTEKRRRILKQMIWSGPLRAIIVVLKTFRQDGFLMSLY